MLSPAEVSRQWYEEMWNGRREDLIDVLMAQHAVAHGLGPQSIEGAAGFKPFYRSFVAAVPDLKLRILRMVSEGDIVATHIHAAGTHTGDTMGPATGKPVEFEGMIFARVTNGQIVEGWNCIDFLTFHQQLGRIPNPVQ